MRGIRPSTSILCFSQTNERDSSEYINIMFSQTNEGFSEYINIMFSQRNERFVRVH